MHILDFGSKGELKRTHIIFLAKKYETPIFWLTSGLKLCIFYFLAHKEAKKDAYHMFG